MFGHDFYVETFGCQMNERDSETISALLSDHDMVPVDSPNEADVIILNTCAVRESAESKVWSRLGRLAAESGAMSRFSSWRAAWHSCRARWTE